MTTYKTKCPIKPLFLLNLFLLMFAGAAYGAKSPVEPCVVILTGTSAQEPRVFPNRVVDQNIIFERPPGFYHDSIQYSGKVLVGTPAEIVQYGRQRRGTEVTFMKNGVVFLGEPKPQSPTQWHVLATTALSDHVRNFKKILFIQQIVDDYRNISNEFHLDVLTEDNRRLALSVKTIGHEPFKSKSNSDDSSNSTDQDFQLVVKLVQEYSTLAPEVQSAKYIFNDYQLALSEDGHYAISKDGKLDGNNVVMSGILTAPNGEMVKIIPSTTPWLKMISGVTASGQKVTFAYQTQYQGESIYGDDPRGVFIVYSAGKQIVNRSFYYD